MGLRFVKTPTAAIALALGLLALGGALGALGSPVTHAIAPSATPRVTGPTYAPLQPLARPAVIHPATQSVTITFANETPPAYTLIGSSVKMSVTFFNLTMNASNTNVSFSLYANLGTSAPYLVAPFSTWAIPVTSVNQTTYTTVINQTNAAPHMAPWTHGIWPAATEFFMSAWIDVYPNSTIANPSPYGPLNASAGTLALTEIVINAPWATLLSPSPAAAAPEVTPGNVTVVIQYSGDAINTANISIYNSAKTLTYSAILTSIYTGNVTSAASAPWLVVQPGAYTAVIALTTDYSTAASDFSFAFTVAKSTGPGTIVWLNSTVFHNGSSAKPLISGLSNPATASLLLVVGLIIGLIVALVLGRMMWGSPPTPPAQPWSGSKPSSNECPVCHQSFASEDEMKEHQKTAHGM
jgi:hypothetical protein